MVETIKEIKKDLTDEAVLAFWIYKMTMKMYNIFNNIPLRQVKYPDAQGFEISFGVCEMDFPKET
jgi:hypothetical protein